MTTSRSIRCWAALTALSALLALSGCASQELAIDEIPEVASSRAYGNPVVAEARKMLGRPYRYGGNSPEGFDCSGLVQYVYNRVGVALPRSASAQYHAVEKIPLEKLQPGDLLFFKIFWRKISHVGIYIDKTTFLHAPSGGKRVSYVDLKLEYWRSRFVGAGRVM